MPRLVPFSMTRPAQAMLALRPGPMDSVQLTERYGERVKNIQAGLAEAIRLGFVVKTPTGDANIYRYELTEEGRKACPARRQVRLMDYLDHMRDVASDEEAFVSNEAAA